MTDEPATPPQPTGSAPAPAVGPPARRPEWVRRAIAGAVIAAGIVVAVLVGNAVIPRWWAHRIGDQVNGSQLAGTGFGLLYGLIFTLLPLVALRFVVRRGRSWRFRAWMVALAVVLALPNLFTLGIVIGSSSAAHAGQRTFDVEAPNFRAATLAGAIVAAVLFAGVWYLVGSRRRARRREAELRDQLRARDRDPGTPAG